MILFVEGSAEEADGRRVAQVFVLQEGERSQLACPFANRESRFRLTGGLEPTEKSLFFSIAFSNDFSSFFCRANRLLQNCVYLVNNIFLLGRWPAVS